VNCRRCGKPSEQEYHTPCAAVEFAETVKIPYALGDGDTIELSPIQLQIALMVARGNDLAMIRRKVMFSKTTRGYWQSGGILWLLKLVQGKDPSCPRFLELVADLVVTEGSETKDSVVRALLRALRARSVWEAQHPKDAPDSAVLGRLLQTFTESMPVQKQPPKPVSRATKRHATIAATVPDHLRTDTIKPPPPANPDPAKMTPALDVDLPDL
jgi:hypothetical protein